MSSPVPVPGPGPDATVRVGVVADSHVGEFLDRMPDTVAETLAGCALILHAGDVCDEPTLTALAAVAPVVAVRGDHDAPSLRRLPRQTVVTVAGRRIGLTHGRRWYPLDAAVILVSVATGGRLRWRAGLHRTLLRRVGDVDALVYGHWHEPVEVVRDGVLVFCPGAVCPWGSLEGGREPRPGVRGVADRVVRRFRRQLGPEAVRPAVGILEVGSTGIRARRVMLDAEPSPGDRSATAGGAHAAPGGGAS